MQGYIPEKLKIFIKEEKVVGQVWDGFEYSDPDVKTVKPAFVTDLENKKTHETGKKWAENAHWYNQPKQKYTEEDRDNTPISGYKIVTLEHRGEGGRAYKVVSPDGLYVDLREDVLLDTMLNVGVQKDGILNGEYIFARVNSEMKLIRVDSQVHKELLKLTNTKEKGLLKTKDLIPGGIYKTKKGKYCLFLGFVNTTKYELYSNKRNNYNYYAKAKDIKYYVAKKDNKKVAMYIDIWAHKNDDIKKEASKRLKEYTNVTADSWWRKVDLVQKPSFLEKVDEIKLPTDLLEKLRKVAASDKQKKLKEIVVNKNHSYSHGETDSYLEANIYCDQAEYMLLSTENDPSPYKEEIDHWFSQTNTQVDTTLEKDKY